MTYFITDGKDVQKTFYATRCLADNDCRALNDEMRKSGISGQKWQVRSFDELELTRRTCLDS